MSCGEFGCVALQPSRVRRAQDKALDVCGVRRSRYIFGGGIGGSTGGLFTIGTGAAALKLSG
jgi:hypothetical protein